MGAGNSDPFSIDATDVRELGSRAKYGEAAADEDQRLLDKLHVAEETLGIERKTFLKVQDEARSQQKAADKALNEVKQAVQVEQNELASVKGDIGQLVDQIAAEKQQADDAAARAEFQAVQARARAEAAAARAERGERRRNASHRRTAVRCAGAGRGSHRRRRVRRGHRSASHTDMRAWVRTRTTARD